MRVVHRNGTTSFPGVTWKLCLTANPPALKQLGAPRPACEAGATGHVAPQGTTVMVCMPTAGASQIPSDKNHLWELIADADAWHSLYAAKACAQSTSKEAVLLTDAREP